MTRHVSKRRVPLTRCVCRVKQLALLVNTGTGVSMVIDRA